LVPVKKHSVEKIIVKLREIEKVTAQGMWMPMAARKVGATDQTFISLLSLADSVRCAQGGGQTTAAARRS